MALGVITGQSVRDLREDRDSPGRIFEVELLELLPGVPHDEA